MDSGVLLALTEQCDGTVKFVDLVEVHYDEKSRRLFLCIGEHGFFLLKRGSLRRFGSGELYYEHMDRFTESTAAPSDILITLKPSAKPDWAAPSLWIRNFQKETLMKYLKVAWCSDHMCRYGRTGTFPYYRGPLPNCPFAKAAHYPKVVPFLGYQEVEYGGYTFFLSEDFEDRVTTAVPGSTGNYISPRGIEVAVHVHSPLPVSALPEVGRESIKATAAEYRRSLTERLKHYELIYDQAYHKKMNVADDPCAWTGWELVCGTPKGLTSLVLFLRSYAFALMDQCQEIVVVFFMTAEDLAETKTTVDDFVREARLTADSMAPASVVHCYFRDLLQYKLDVLLLSEESCQWLEARMKLVPSLLPKAKSFVKTLLTQLHKAAVLKDPGLIDDVGEKVPVEEHAIQALNAVVRAAEGFDVYDVKSPDQLRLQHQWQMRAARYLAYVLDGQLLGGRFRLADLIAAAGIPHLDPEIDQRIRQIIEFLVHVRSTDWVEPFSGTFLSRVVTTGTTPTFLFNDRVMKTLIDTGYAGKLFPKGAERMYIQFLAALIQSPFASASLKATICHRVLLATSTRQTESVALQELLMGLVPGLLTIVKAGVASPLVSADVGPPPSALLATLAVVVLVSLSAGSTAVKSVLVNAGIAAAAVNQMRVEQDIAARQYIAKLIVNLTKTSAQRDRFMSAGIIPVLADVIAEEYDSPQKLSQELLYDIAAIVGHLANEPVARDQLVMRYPTLDCLLYMFHTTESFSHGRLRTVFAIRQLALHSWQVRQRIGLHTLQPTLHDLRNIKRETSVDYAANLLALLFVLALYKPFCVEMKESQVESILDGVVSTLQLSSIVEKVEKIRVRIARHIRTPLLT